MKSKTAAVCALLLAGCAAAPITRISSDEWVIGESGRDTMHTDATVRSRHFGRAQAICGEGRVVEILAPDKMFHFRCVPPERSTAQQVNDARQAWLACMRAEEPAVDDLISDGHTVAAVLATRCENEVDTLVSLVRKGHRDWSLPADALQRVRRQVALDVVLQTRAQKRNPSAQVPAVEIPPLGPDAAL